ncbi:hypothetical protein FWC31_01990 [Candidatus Saccharibacteria bacterium]|nr:hypothetical protein [Candidatus Saccharibacteria bacterium]
MEKRINPRTKRLKYYACCLDLLGNSTCEPTIKPDPGDANRRFYRFYGRSADGYEFIVQVVEEIKTGNKFLISCFPPGHRE